MRLLLLGASLPYPVDIGHKVVLSGFLEFAVGLFGRDNVAFLCVSSDRDHPDGTKLAPCPVFFFPVSAGPVRVAAAVFQSLLLRRRAIQEVMVSSYAEAGRITRFIDAFDPDVVLVDTLRVMQHLPPGKDHSYRRVLFMDDLFSLRYRSMLEAMVRYPEAAIDPVGTFAKFLPGPIRRVARGRGVQRYLLTLESEILAHRERAMPALFDQVLLLNDKEAAKLRKATGAGNVVSVKPLLRNLAPVGRRHHVSRPVFLFLGNLKYPSNAYGLSLFLRRAMPKFLELRGDAELLVAGRGADASLRDLCDSFGGHVRLLDFVEDLTSLVNSCAGLIAPLVFGTGIKIKIVEGLARGIPIVTTSWGTDGLNLVNGVHCLVEEDVAAFPAAMLRLLDPAVGARLSEAGRAYFSRYLSPDVVRRGYMSAILGMDVARASPEPLTLAPMDAFKECVSPGQ